MTGRFSDLDRMTDNGCREATDYLGRQSHCLECPFEQCVLEVPLKIQHRHRRDKEIRRKVKKGVSIEELAREHKVSITTIERIAGIRIGSRRRH